MPEDGRHFFRNGKPVVPRVMERSEVAQASAGGTVTVQAAVELAGSSCVRIFIAGAVTHIGKTTVCLSILAALREAGIAAEHLAYVKPATQCEAPDLLKQWCDDEGVEYVSGENAPLVFYSGFTRSFLAGEQGTSIQWMDRIARKVDELARGRRVLVVDGVGFPSVGSIVGVDNADVARAARAPVLLVCKSGVGGAVDSFNLNSAYFQAKGVPVLGAIFNMGELDGMYAWPKCAENIKLWFDQAVAGGRRERYYGVVPLAPKLQGLRERVSQTDQAQLRTLAMLNAAHFAAHVDLPALLTDAALDPWCRRGEPPKKKPRLGEAPSISSVTAEVGSPITFEPKSRSAVVAEVVKFGGRPGG